MFIANFPAGCTENIAIIVHMYRQVVFIMWNHNLQESSLKDDLRNQLRQLMAEKLKMERCLIELERQIEQLQAKLVNLR